MSPFLPFFFHERVPKVEVSFGVEAEVVIEVEVKDFDTFSNLNFRFDKVCTLSLSVHRKSEEDNK